MRYTMQSSKRKKKKVPETQKNHQCKACYGILKRYSDAIQNHESLTKILDQAENVLREQKVAKGAQEEAGQCEGNF